MTYAAAIIEPFLEPLDANGDYILPTTQYIANAAILVVFVYLVALVIMEVNYFRFAVHMAWRQMERSNSSGGQNGKVMDMLENGIELQGNEEDVGSIVDKNCTKSVSSSEMSFMMTPPRRNNDVENDPAEGQSDNDSIQIIDQGITVVTQHQSTPSSHHNNDSSGLRNSLSSSKHSAIGLLLQDVRSNLPLLHHTSPLRIKNRSSSIISVDSSRKCITDHDDNPNNNNINLAALQNAYKTIHKSSLIAILTSLTLYTITATLISIYTRGLKDEVIAVIVGSSKFVASVIVFILSAKFPQWVSIYMICVVCWVFSVLYYDLLLLLVPLVFNTSCTSSLYFTSCSHYPLFFSDWSIPRRSNPPSQMLQQPLHPLHEH